MKEYTKTLLKGEKLRMETADKLVSSIYNISGEEIKLNITEFTNSYHITFLLNKVFMQYFCESFTILKEEEK
ncbi:MAG: hypothetical protein LIR50_04270 [Bacillota bacterium]|nr:hypothetical protein [Bacillota bacterium]